MIDTCKINISNKVIDSEHAFVELINTCFCKVACISNKLII